jgi:hypothetical protein
VAPVGEDERHRDRWDPEEAALHRGRDRAGVQHVVPKFAPWLMPEISMSGGCSRSP